MLFTIKTLHSLFQNSKKKTTLSKFIKKLRQFLYLHQESFLCLFSNVWLKWNLISYPDLLGQGRKNRVRSGCEIKWNWQISKLKNTTNFERKYGAFFIQPKPRLLNFRELPVANRAAFSKISIKEDNLAWYTQIFEKFCRKFSFPATLHVKISRNFGWVVRISEIQPFPGFLKLFREISVPFYIRVSYKDASFGLGQKRTMNRTLKFPYPRVHRFCTLKSVYIHSFSRKRERNVMTWAYLKATWLKSTEFEGFTCLWNTVSLPAAVLVVFRFLHFYPDIYSPPPPPHFFLHCLLLSSAPRLVLLDSWTETVMNNWIINF